VYKVLQEHNNNQREGRPQVHTRFPSLSSSSPLLEMYAVLSSDYLSAAHHEATHQQVEEVKANEESHPK